MDITALLHGTEGKTLEFKRDLSSPDKVLRTIISFANTAGGTILIGVEDGTKHIRGVADPILEEERLANLISDNIYPKLIPDMSIIPWRNKYILAIETYPSNVRPHYLKSEGLEKSVYVRVGSTNRVADKALLQEFRRFTRDETFDEQPYPDLNSEAIDFRAASELFAPYRKLKHADLKTLKLLANYHNKEVPTVGGILLFGRNRNDHFPDAWIQVGCFRGINRSKIIDATEIHEYPVLAVEEAIRFINKYTIKGAEIGMIRRIDNWSLPPLAIREAVINAVVHADYSQKGAPIRISMFDDRLEIENPGLIPFNLTIDDLRNGISKLRNPVLGRVFKELHLIEQWGSGIKRMTEACYNAGLDAPLLEEIGSHFRVTIFTQKILKPKLNKIDSAIIDYLKENEGLSTRDIAAQINISVRSTRTHLIYLIERGYAAEIASSPQDPRRKYFLTKRFKTSNKLNKE